MQAERKERPRGKDARDGVRGEVSDTVGPARDQAHAFTLKHRDIDPNKNQTADIVANPAGCVHLESATIEDKEALFVVMCDKTPDGKCKDCTAAVTLRVSEIPAAGGAAQVKASRVVRVVCKKN
jgi:hypothetical protein